MTFLELTFVGPFVKKKLAKRIKESQLCARLINALWPFLKIEKKKSTTYQVC